MGKLIICIDCGERFEMFKGERCQCPECGSRQTEWLGEEEE